MTANAQSSEIGAALSQLALVDRITIALSAARGPEPLLHTIATVFWSPRGLRFSRVFLLTYDDRRECFVAQRAMGIASAEQTRRYVEEIEEERESLDAFTKELASPGDHEHFDLLKQVDPDSLRAEVAARADDAQLDVEGWRDLHVVPDRDDPDDLFARLASDRLVVRLDEKAQIAALPPPLNRAIEAPAVALSVHTSKGARLAILADRAGQADPTISRSDLSLLEWLRSQMALAWSGTENHADLERALEDVRELDTLKSNFLATISHELRTPLTAILGFLGLVIEGRMGPVVEEQRKLLDRSRRQADQLLGRVNDLLELTDYQAEGVRPLAVGRVDVQVALQAAANRLGADNPSRQARIVAPPPGNGRCLVLANEAALERILYHLLDNALKFGPQDSEVTVQFDQVGDNWYVAVADRGIGIDRSQLRKAFSHFYQVDSRLSRAYPGIGIGLTLVKILLEATGGHILLESDVGKGTIITVVYPGWRGS